MKKMKTVCKGIILSLTCGLLITGCASDNAFQLDSPAHLSQIKKDRETLHQDINKTLSGTLSLTLDQAIDRALQHNLDGRVAIIETLVARDNVSLAEFEIIPNLTASGTFTRRSNDAASSSRSVLTGIQSLEPSTSSQQARRLADLQAQWNIMDGVIAYLDAKTVEDQARISSERLKKVKENIQRDVFNAYWQAYAGEESAEALDQLLVDIEKYEDAITDADDRRLLNVDQVLAQLENIQQRKQSMTNLREEVDLAKIELKTISGLPPETNIALATKPQDIQNKLKSNMDFNEIEKNIQIALQNRPEMREEFLKYNIAVKNTEKELIRTFPGLNIIFSKNYDSNSFLSEDGWLNFSAALSQSITDFISLPQRYEASKNKELLETARRKALTAAIIAQVYIGNIRIAIAEDNYSLTKKRAQQAQRQAFLESKKKEYGQTSGFTEFLSRSDRTIKKIEEDQAFADMQQAYVDMMGTLGLPIFRSIRSTEAQL